MIGGNITATIQTYTTSKNDIGEMTKDWKDTQTLTGWLDLMAGTSDYINYSFKVQESTHIFLSDYVELANGIQAETSRMTIDGKAYDIMLIDDPMGMHRQLEFYLKYTGGI